MYFALFYETVDNFVERRQPYREAHLALARKAHEAGTLVMAGALKPAEGALLIFRAGARSAVEAFVHADPYVTNGLVRDWRVREWTVVIGP